MQNDKIINKRQTKINPKLENGGNYSGVLPLKAARQDSIYGFKSELQSNPMPFHLELLWGVTLMPPKVCDGLGQNKVMRVGKNSELWF